MKQNSYRRNALFITLLLVFVTVGSLLWILYTSTQSHNNNNTNKKDLIADIYQDGTLLQSIPLSSVVESYTFTINGENDIFNEIEVHPGSIGIISASCPDKLCMHQGFISTSLLPITCLPNHLVIQIRQASEEITPDIITY